MTTPTMTEKYLVHLFHDAGLVELCHMEDRRLAVSHHRDAASLLAEARARHRTGNLFTTLNRIDAGKWRAYEVASRQDDPSKLLRTPDAVIQRYTRLFFDLDPVRPKGQSSTADELEVAQTRALGLKAKLAALGWPEPMMAMSGNGWHLQYRTALPNTPATSEQLRLIYTALAAEFSDDEVTFDKSVRNPARLCTLYGSVKRKGVNHPERPHRKSVAILPDPWLQVHPRQVAGLANFYAAQTPAPETRPAPVHATKVGGRGDYRSLDVVAWFMVHGAYVGRLGERVHGVRCPWSAEHSTPSPKSGSDSIVFESDGGWPGFNCKHSHCADRDIRAVMTLWGDADNFCGAAFQPVRRAG